MIRRHYCLLLVLLLAAHLCGCRPVRPATERPSAGIAPRNAPAQPDSLLAKNKRNEIETEKKPGFLSGLGTVFSTPAGIERRQAVRLAAAAVPRSIKVKDGAFSWGGDAVAIGKKAGPSLIKSDSATLQVATNAVAGRGNTATQTATETKPGFWSALLGNPVGQIGLAVIGLFIVGAGVYGFVLWKKKKQVTDILA